MEVPLMSTIFRCAAPLSPFDFVEDVKPPVWASVICEASQEELRNVVVLARLLWHRNRNRVRGYGPKVHWCFLHLTVRASCLLPLRSALLPSSVHPSACKPSRTCNKRGIKRGRSSSEKQNIPMYVYKRPPSKRPPTAKSSSCGITTTNGFTCSLLQ